MQKYKLTNESKIISKISTSKTQVFIRVYRIQALKDFADVKTGDYGGWVESEDNLLQEGTCWIYDNAMVYQNAKVKNNAVVKDFAEVYGKALYVIMQK